MRCTAISLAGPAAVGLVIALGLAAPPATAAPPYTFTNFDVPGSEQTEATDINEAGQVVGFYYARAAASTASCAAWTAPTLP